ncbi:MAG: PelD GGDEF domain-containing protein [Gammaproteobacteria bacterium]|nr:PelD GGDEF domain-containing protein [Gammaproteobacteria bacterium]
MESLILTTLILSLCYLLNPDDPLCLHGSLPWPWLAGIIIVLQHGFGPGVLSALMVTGATIIFRQTHDFPLIAFQNFLLSGFTLLLICAAFSSSRIRRMLNAEELLDYTNQRLDSLSSSYYMLHLSYDYLEHNVITKPYTLRIALKDLQQMCIKHKGELSDELCHLFLKLLSQFCLINSAGIYLYKKGSLSKKPAAEEGKMGPLDLNDPLVRRAMDQQELTYISFNQLENVHECQYLVAIPMTSSQNTCLGVLVIKDMSLWTLNKEILTTLGVLSTYFTGEIANVKEFPALLKKYPECPSDFSQLLKQLISLQQKLQIDSAMCAIMIPKKLRPYNVVESLQKLRRFPDSTFTVEVGKYDVFITLLAFTNATGIHGFFTRMTDYLTEELGITPSDKNIKMRSSQLHGSDYLEYLQDFITFISAK